jgi:tRNA pseudouridine38-40 synthase
LIGYSGTGYKGMQITPTEKTIEGDLFAAFVKAGAISKANADDPKKSSLVRCARTDKGVHAAGNVISLKLIVDEADIVQKINDQLPPQIRIWGIERTIGSFSCYQACDSRWYEYLIPTYSFLPPHPTSYIGQHLSRFANEMGDVAGYEERQKDVLDFWANTDEKYIKPLLDSLDGGTRELVEKALFQEDTNAADMEAIEGADDEDIDENDTNGERRPQKEVKKPEPIPKVDSALDVTVDAESRTETAEASTGLEDSEETLKLKEVRRSENAALDAAIKSLRAAYIKAKNAYRISPSRHQKVVDAFNKYVGTHNFHNYTVRKSPRDPSVKRHIKSFTVSEPIIINDTEWLSLKVHGQSFMMHQIRKMVGTAALLVRCGTPLDRMDESFTEHTFYIPKAPAQGLLLERPVFDNYNAKAVEKFERAPIDFAKYDEEIEAFKRREIYDKIFQVEERDHVFHTFFSQIDNFRSPDFLWVTSKGIAACGSEPRQASNRVELSRKEKKRWAKENPKKAWDRSVKEEKEDAGVAGEDTEADVGDEKTSDKAEGTREG